MNTTPSAVRRRTTIGSRFPQKPQKQNFHQSGEFTQEMSVNMLQLFIEGIIEQISGKNTVTVHSEKNEAQIVLIGNNGTSVSIMFQEGGII